MIRKYYPNYTKHGLGITKTGRLQVPFKHGLTPYPDDKAVEFNCYGQPMPKIGDLISNVSHTGRITKNNIGIIVDIKFIIDNNRNEMLPERGGYIVMNTLTKQNVDL